MGIGRVVRQFMRNLFQLDEASANYDARLNLLENKLDALLAMQEQTHSLVRDKTLALVRDKLSPAQELYHRDLLTILLKISNQINYTLSLETEYPVALDSMDHRQPRGTKNDNTRLPRFVFACERLFPTETLNFIDVGCAGGGLVMDFILRGHRAAGIEGSDFSLLDQRAEWRLLTNKALFTADATKPFSLSGDDGELFRAHIITAWEVLEHIAENDLPGLFANIRRHLKSNGYFVGTISSNPAGGDDEQNDIADKYHRTVKPFEWWTQLFERNGIILIKNQVFAKDDFCRGTGRNPFSGAFGKPFDNCHPFVARIVP